LSALVLTFAFAVIPARAGVTKPNQRDAVISCLVLEARGDGKRGMEAVMHVIHNRSLRDRNRSIYGIVIQRAQFASMTPGWYARARAKTKSWRLASLVYDEYVRTRYVGVKDPTYGAIYFDNPATTRHPRKAPAFRLTARIGEHTFYR
jgi:spore germination cell wall hydrolase CwlJ-like protein